MTGDVKIEIEETFNNPQNFVYEKDEVACGLHIKI